jgi:hypothetical protein
MPAVYRDGVVSTPDDTDLRRNVEELIDALRRRVLENDALVQLLEEREQTVTQLEATILQLQAELRRGRVNPHRVRSAALFVGALLTNAVVSFGAGAGGAIVGAHEASSKPTTVIEIEGTVGDDVRSVLKQCEQLIERSQSHRVGQDETAHASESESVQIINPEGIASTAQFGVPSVSTAPPVATELVANVGDPVNISDTVHVDLRTEEASPPVP